MTEYELTERGGYSERGMLAELAAGQSKLTLGTWLDSHDYLEERHLDDAIEVLSNVAENANAIHHYGDAPYELLRDLRQLRQ
jgi:hypothetical protein